MAAPGSANRGRVRTTMVRTAMQSGGAGNDGDPDTILPAQVVAGARLDASLQPEKRLMLAVLEDAIATLQRNAAANNYRGRRLFKEAFDWCLSDADDWSFAFVNVCHALGIEVPY